MTRTRAESLLEESGSASSNEILAAMERYGQECADEARREEREHQQKLVCFNCGSTPDSAGCIGTEGQMWHGQSVVRAEFERRKGGAG